MGIGVVMGCREQWWNEHKDTCMNAVGFIDKQVLPLDDAWFVHISIIVGTLIHKNTNPLYYIRNKLKGVKQQITREQAQSPEDIQRDYDYVQ